MADMTPTPGVQTSEYALTKYTGMLTALAAVVGIAMTVVESVSNAMPGNKWSGPVLACLGVLGTILTAFGYTVVRGQVKAAAHEAAGNAVVSQAALDVASAKTAALAADAAAAKVGAA